MPVNYAQDAMIELKKYLWNKLTTTTVTREIVSPQEGTFNDLTGGSSTKIFTTEAYNDINNNMQYIPIIPVQQSSDFKTAFPQKKHIVYDKIGITYEDNWMICNEMILFTIYSIYYSDVTEIVNFMIDEFRRMDQSAKDINRSGLILSNFKFHSISVVDLTPTEPSTELAGALAADLVLQIKYSRITDGDGRFT